MAPSSLLSLFFGIIGGGYLLFGWRQRKIVASAAGIWLSVLSMVTDNLWIILITGVLAAVAPWVIREQ